MGHRSNIPSSARGFFYADSGSDALSGTTIELAKATIQECIDAAALLVPTPDFNNPASVSPSQPGESTESITLIGGLRFNSDDISIVATDAFTIKSADSSGSFGGVVGNNQNSSSTFEIDGSELFGVNNRAAFNSGDSSIVYDITGSVEDIFIDVGLTQCSGDGTVGLSFTGQSDSEVALSGARIDLIGDNSIAVLWNPSAASGVGVCAVGSISTTAVSQSSGSIQTATSTTAFDIRAGQYSVNTASIDSDTMCDIDSGAILNLICPESSGTITVNSGGTLNCVLSNHTGTVTNNGTINGIINGVTYGNWQQGVGYVFTSWGGNLQTTGRHPAINGQSNAAQITGLGIDASAQIPADGTIDVLTYYSATGDNTTQFQIILNGAVAHTFTCDAAYGRETGIGMSVAVGDNVAIRYISGTAPANGIYSMYIK